MGQIKLFFIIVFSLSFATASETDLGELTETHYTGPHLPIYKHDRYLKTSVSEDEYFNEWYFNSKVQGELFNLNQFVQGEFLTGHYCPDQVFKQYSELYRYLIRILALSYLFNSIQEYAYTSTQMGEPKTCRPRWEEIFKTCRPQSLDMKTFVKNLRFIIPNIKPVLVPFEQTKQNIVSKWLEEFNNNNIKNLSQARLKSYCDEKKCGLMTKKASKGAFKEICSEDISKMTLICSEEDRFFGLSYAPEVYPLIIRSNALRAVTPAKYQTGCLRRFIQHNKNRELVYRPLKQVFTHLYSKYLRDKAPYKQGRIFIAGALKEFQSKGLENLFEEKAQPKVKPAPTVVAKVQPKIEKIELPKLKPVKKKKKKKKVAPPPKKEKTFTEFYSASTFRRENDLDQIDLDMLKFKYDFVFTLDQQRKYIPIIKKFSSRDSLEKMRRLDGLGLKKAPIPLKFLKLLIDKEMHQDLFNVTLVLGEEFFVINDIDATKDIEFVRLRNNQETNFKWNLSILKPKS